MRFLFICNISRIRAMQVIFVLLLSGDCLRVRRTDLRCKGVQPNGIGNWSPWREANEILVT